MLSICPAQSGVEALLRSCLCLLSISIVAAGCALTSVAAGSGLTSSAGGKGLGSPAQLKDFREVPLWHFVEVRHFAILGEGTIGGFRWGVYTFRGHGPDGGEKPCIQEVNVWLDGGYSSGVECGPLTPPSNWPVFTLTHASFKGQRGKAVEASSLAMTLGRVVRRVVIDFGPGPSESRGTRALNVQQAKKARVRPFSYVAFGLRRSVCLEGVTGFDDEDTQLFDTSHYDCSGPGIVIPHG